MKKKTKKELYFWKNHFSIDVSANSVAIFNIDGYLNRTKTKTKHKLTLFIDFEIYENYENYYMRCVDFLAFYLNQSLAVSCVYYV
jgi:hypothetical protein